MSVYGIDLGTSFVKLARLEGEKCETVSLSNVVCVLGSDKLLVSAVYLLEGGEFAVGQTAYNMRGLAPERYASEFKRRFGQSAPYTLAGQTFTVESLYVEVLRRLRAVVQEKGWEAGEVVITYPATYTQDKIDLLRHAANTAGLWHVTLLDEPAAAAACYAKEQSAQVGEKQLVYDFGGGTFDVSLVEKTADGVRHLCRSKGLANCGGSDFDRVIFEDIKQKLLANPDVDGERAIRNHAFQLQLFETAVKVKHQISGVDLYTENIIVGFDSFCYTLTKDEFNRLIEPYVAKTIATCKEIVAEAGLKDEDIARILPVGGTCSIPYIRATLKRSFPNAEVATLSEPSFMVCRGAALSTVAPKQEKRGKQEKQPEAAPNATKPQKQASPTPEPQEEKIASEPPVIQLPPPQSYKEKTVLERTDIKRPPEPAPNATKPPKQTAPAPKPQKEKPVQQKKEIVRAPEPLFMPVLFSGNFDKTIRVWDVPTEKCYKVLRGHQTAIESMAVSGNGEWAISASGWTNSFSSWDIKAGARARLIYGHENSVKYMAINYDGTMAITAAADNKVKLWNPRTGQCLNTLVGINNPVTINSTGRLIGYAINDDTRAIVNTETLEILCKMGGTGAIELNPAGEVVAYRAKDGTLRIMHPYSGFQKTINGSSNIKRIAISKGNRIITTNGTNIATVWDRLSGSCVCNLIGHTGTVESVDISYDGSLAVTASDDKTIRLWDTDNGKCLRVTKDCFDFVFLSLYHIEVAFSRPR